LKVSWQRRRSLAEKKKPGREEEAWQRRRSLAEKKKRRPVEGA
jgi:hypothetical protein